MPDNYVPFPGSETNKIIPINANGRGNAIPDSPKQEKGDRKQKQEAPPPSARWQGVPISQLQADAEHTDWYWHGYAGAQIITLFTGLWKAGKSTLISTLLKALETEDTFCGKYIKPTKILLVTEEAARHWIERRDNLGIGDHVDVVCRPFLQNPSKADWVYFLANIASQVKEGKHGLVVFDSIFNLWAVQNENDAPEVKEALIPMNMTLEEGAGVILVAHPKKGDAAEGQATRGTGALPAYVDIILEMRRFDPEHREDTKRVLTTYSRFEDTAPEMVIEYDKSARSYRAIGTKADVKSGERIDLLLRVLPSNGTAYTVEEILQNWPVDEGFIKPGERTLKRDVDAAVKQSLIHVRGEGIKGDPHRYYRT